VIFYLVWAAIFVTGVGLAAAGSRRPSLAERVDALRPVSLKPAPPPPVYSLRILESARPAIEAAGFFLTRRLHLNAEDLGRRLALAGHEESLALFIGTKALFALLALVGVPILAASAVPVLPAWAAPLLAAGAWFAPDLAIREQGRVRKVRLEDGLVTANLDIALRVAGGAGLSEAIQEAAAGDGEFARELSVALARARLARRSPADALEDLSARSGLEEARDLAGVLRAAEQGAPLTETLLTQARGIAERHRREAEAAGQRAEILMIVVQAALILPGFFILILYPVASGLLGIARA
jgi:Flp pilus assembly protein TadB